MNILYPFLLVFLAHCSISYAEPLARIEEKLALRLAETQKADQTLEEDSTIETGDDDVDDPFSQATSSAVFFRIGKSTGPIDTFKHPYSVQVGSSRSQNLSHRIATMLRKLGYPAFNSSIDLNSRGVWYRVFVGAFATRDRAQEMKIQLQREDIVEGFLRHLQYGVQVGSSGNYQQLEQLYKRLLANSHLPYSTPIRNASSDRIEERLLVGACYVKEDCSLLLTNLRNQGFSGVIIER